MIGLWQKVLLNLYVRYCRKSPTISAIITVNIGIPETKIVRLVQQYRMDSHEMQDKGKGGMRCINASRETGASQYP